MNRCKVVALLTILLTLSYNAYSHSYTDLHANGSTLTANRLHITKPGNWYVVHLQDFSPDAPLPSVTAHVGGRTIPMNVSIFNNNSLCITSASRMSVSKGDVVTILTKGKVFGTYGVTMSKDDQACDLFNVKDNEITNFTPSTASCSAHVPTTIDLGKVTPGKIKHVSFDISSQNGHVIFDIGQTNGVVKLTNSDGAEGVEAAGFPNDNSGFISWPENIDQSVDLTVTAPVGTASGTETATGTMVLTCD